jgi:hypothetical protein
MNSLVKHLKAIEAMAIDNSVMQTTKSWGPRFSTTAMVTVFLLTSPGRRDHTG